MRFSSRGSTLALLEFGVLLVDDEESSLAADDLAIRGADLQGCTGLHDVCLLVSERNAAFGQVIGRKFNTYLVASENANVVFAHLS